MNQSILFNDDHHFDEVLNSWVFSGIIAGEIIKIVIDSELSKDQIITDEIKFDWESIVEDWLDENEPENQIITINNK